MKFLNIQKELMRLRINFIAQLKCHGLHSHLKHADRSFEHHNWIITLPYNYYYLCSEIDIQFIRKLAVINALYGCYFMIEDDMLDEYHLPPRIYRKILSNYCKARSMRNLAIGQMISLCGEGIFEYIFEYEHRYYDSLLLEKCGKPLAGLHSCFLENIDALGEKAIPAVIPFAVFCIKNNCEHKLDQCEQLIKRYHIAHQIYDDLRDFDKDILRPDKSWLIFHLEQKMKMKITDARQIRSHLRTSNYAHVLIERIQCELIEAKSLAKSLNFYYLLDCIEYLDTLVVNYSKKVRS